MKFARWKFLAAHVGAAVAATSRPWTADSTLIPDLSARAPFMRVRSKARVAAAENNFREDREDRLTATDRQPASDACH